MFKKIVVPLDGSWQAETALPLALNFARHFNSELVLFNPAGGIGNQFISDEMGRVEALRYLDTVRKIITDPKVALSHDPAKIRIIEAACLQEEAICRYILSDKNVLLISSKGLPFISRTLAENFVTKKPFCYLEVPAGFTNGTEIKNSTILDKLNSYPQFPLVSKVGVIVDPLSDSLEVISVAAKLAGSFRATFYLLSSGWPLNKTEYHHYTRLNPGEYLTLSRGRNVPSTGAEEVRFAGGETLNSMLSRNGIKTVIGYKLDKTGLPVQPDFALPYSSSILVTAADQTSPEGKLDTDKLQPWSNQIPVIYVNESKAEFDSKDSNLTELYRNSEPGNNQRSAFNSGYPYSYSLASRKSN